MGEVYRARDTRLDRTVAIKILAAELSADPTRKQRFEREAKTISTLNHPNICTLYDVGNQDGIEFLVMECIEGETLARRLERGALSTELVLKIGAEIAGGLDKAHRSGVVHRDLKPGNIMLTKMGAKLLDFGLAKPTFATTVNSATMTAIATNSPVTREGTIIGTFQYMSPEQIEGKELDGRSDIFSLGAVLYEMITGKRAFDGKSQLSVASAIIEKEPVSISDSKPLTPPALDRAVRRCLAKDPEDRWQTARDLAIELNWLSTLSGESARLPITSYPKSNRWIAWTIAALALLAASISVLVLIFSHKGLPNPAVLRASILPPEKAQFASIETDEGGVPAVSPDGRYLVTPVHDADGKVRLWLRAVESTAGKILPGTEGSGHAFWSPDSHAVGFFAGGKLKRIDLAGSSVYTVCDAPFGRGGTWNSDGIILFSPLLSAPLFKVPASGGTPVQVTKLDAALEESSHRWPQFLPDGRHFIFVVRSDREDRTGLFAGSLESSDYHLISPTIFNAAYVSGGYLLYVRDELLFAQRFNPNSQKLSGDPVPLADRVGLYGPANNALFSASDTGILAYYPARSGNSSLVPYWYDRSGKKSDPVAQGYSIASTISPDGTAVALSTYGANEWGSKLWKLDIQRGTKLLLSGGRGSNGSPVWEPDGQSVIFSHSRAGVAHVYRTKANGDGREEVVIATDGYVEVPLSICRDGKTLLFTRSPLSETQETSLWAFSLGGEPRSFQLLPSDVRPVRASFSPDCTWVAYESRASSERAIFAVHFPDGARKYQISAYGIDPKWSRDGKELYFYSPQDSSISAIPVQEKGQELSLGKAVQLFAVHPYIPRLGVFDVTADGQKFLVFGDTGTQSTVPLTIVMNWDADLPQK